MHIKNLGLPRFLFWIHYIGHPIVVIQLFQIIIWRCRFGADVEIIFQKSKNHLDKSKYVWYNNKVNIGMSPSGKAPDFDSGTRRFESGHPSQKKARASVLFSVIFALRRVLLLRSDIRLTPSGIRFASLRGEYNITAERSEAISLLRSKNITLTKSAYH